MQRKLQAKAEADAAAAAAAQKAKEDAAVAGVQKAKDDPAAKAKADARLKQTLQQRQLHKRQKKTRSVAKGVKTVRVDAG